MSPRINNNTKMDIKNKVKKGLTYLTVLSTLGSFTGCSKDIPVEYENFPRLEQGFEVADFNIPTKGEVIRIKKLEDQGYGYVYDQRPDGRLTIAGVFEYEIKPKSRFAPKDRDHSDNLGRTPWENDYWVDQRAGTVTLEKATE